MIPRRIQCGRCSFVLPADFEVLERASSFESRPLEWIHCKEGGKSPVCLTLMSTTFHPGVRKFSRRAEDMDPDAYPVSMILTTFVAENVSPLAYLLEACKVYQDHFNDFKVHFSREDRVGKFPAALSQYSYETNFRLFSLNFAWLTDEQELVTAMTTVPASGLVKGWDNLRRFVESVRL